jgi:hypothetical protein
MNKGRSLNVTEMCIDIVHATISERHGDPVPAVGMSDEERKKL